MLEFMFRPVGPKSPSTVHVQEKQMQSQAHDTLGYDDSPDPRSLAERA